MSLQLLPLGVGDAFSATHYSFCLLVEHDGSRLLIDCPHPVRKMLVEASRLASGTANARLDVGDIDGVVLTHLHADHCSGLESLAYFFRFALQRKLPLLAHPDVLARLWDGALAAGMEQLRQHGDAGLATERFGLRDFFEITELSFEQPTAFGPFAIEARPTVHHIPTTALRISSGNSGDATTLGISADTRFDPELLRWLLEADLVVHEVGWGDMHSAPDSLAALDNDTKEKLRLVHYPDELELEPLGIAPLRQGVTIEVKAKPGTDTGTR
jgi:ribonuclease BN (tRNA processing enzyme)